jgi:hypothetical protein
MALSLSAVIPAKAGMTNFRRSALSKRHSGQTFNYLRPLKLALPTSYGLSDAVSRFRQKVHTDPLFSIERLNNLTPAVGERHDVGNMAAIDR